MKEIVEKIKELGFGEYAVINKDGVVNLIVFMGYEYYKEISQKNFSVSPYYFASNKAYFASKELAKYICSFGYTAEVKNHIIYDDLLESCGAIRGDNNLFFIEGLGSLFCVHIIETDAPLAEKLLCGKECIHCGRCISACPMKALTSAGIDKDLCLRERMDRIGDEACRNKISTLLGCDVCQKVCPNNSAARSEKTYPQFDKGKILSGDLYGLAELIGKNMARKHRLQFQAMCMIANMKETEYKNRIEHIDDEELKDTKKWCLGILKDVD